MVLCVLIETIPAKCCDIIIVNLLAPAVPGLSLKISFAANNGISLISSCEEVSSLN
jgi:hypothetical protein